MAGKGIWGDRFFDFKPNYKGQITFFPLENLLQMWDDLGIPPAERDPSAPRRNVITAGVDLGKLIGLEFEIQSVRFFGAEECRPCYWMNNAIHPEAEAWMMGRGGLRAKILSDGWLKKTSETPCRRLVGTLIAGGKSTRMGFDKACLTIGGIPLWRRQLGLLKSLCERVAVAAPAPPSWQPGEYGFLPDAPGAKGPLAGLLAGLEWAESCGATHLLALAVDMPRMTTRTLKRLINSCQPGTGSVPVGSQGFEPLCAVYPVEARSLLQSAAGGGFWKLQDLVERLIGNQHLVAQFVQPDERGDFLNLNSPEDLPEVEN